jgi:SAM-dependent methyltransferase
MKCRHCATPLVHCFLDLGFAPPSNAYIQPAQTRAPELYYPLRLNVCDACWLVQTEDYARADELFAADYAYFSSTSSGWLAHAAQYAQDIVQRLGLGQDSFVIEVASNDGYLLKNFVATGIPCLGIEPTDSTADAAEKLGIPVLRRFFGQSLADELTAGGQQADLIIGNNVYAHVPDINDFTAGLKAALKPGGTVTLEFPHLMNLIEKNQFDTVYHEHFSYLSLQTVQGIFAAAGLRVIDVETLSTHGGSLRVFGAHADDARPTAEAVHRMLESEAAAGLQQVDTYLAFQARAEKVKNDLLMFLVEQRRAGAQVAAYGAAAKGNTLLNYAGVKPDLVSFVCDAAASKQGRLMPGSHIPIVHPDVLKQERPDYVLILPWNIAGEVIRDHAGIAEWGGRFVVAVPELLILN